MRRRAADLRRGFTLVQVIGLLPIVLALTIAAYALADRLEGMQAREAARQVDDLRVRDVVRRIQEDAAGAERAETAVGVDVPATQPAEETAQTRPAGEAYAASRELVLFAAHRKVTYRATSEKVTRVEQIDDEATVEYAWPLGSTEMTFRLEAVSGQPRLVWILCKTALSFDAGPDLERRLTAVARINRGGAR